MIQVHKVKKNAAPSFWYFTVFRYKDNDSCLNYAAKGYLCGKEAGPCDATDLLKNEPQCPDIQVYVFLYAPYRAMRGKINCVYLIATMPGRHSGRHSGDQVHKVKKNAAPFFF